jgi:hypothetical protein
MCRVVVLQLAHEAESRAEERQQRKQEEPRTFARAEEHHRHGDDGEVEKRPLPAEAVFEDGDRARSEKADEKRRRAESKRSPAGDRERDDAEVERPHRQCDASTALLDLRDGPSGERWKPEPDRQVEDEAEDALAPKLEVVERSSARRVVPLLRHSGRV